jgi:hypothetical protein
MKIKLKIYSSTVHCELMYTSNKNQCFLETSANQKKITIF